MKIYFFSVPDTVTKANIKNQFLLFVLFSCVQQVFAQPAISSFSPVQGQTGATVTITGTNFNTTAANNIVYFGATKATVTAALATSLTVTVPTGATYQPISVFNTATALTGYSSSPFGFINTFTSTNSITSSDISAAQSFTTGTAPSAICIADIDGDGKADIATSNFTSGTVSILRNTSVSGTISFAAKVDIGTSSEPYALTIGDINGDGKPDLIVANSFTAGGAGVGNTITVFRNTSTSGSISFAAGVSFTTGNEPYAIAIGDINGDGKPDLAVADYNNGNATAVSVSILRNTSSAGSVSFAAQTTLTTTAVAGGVSLGDLDGDGKPDLAVSNSGIFGSYGTSVSVFLNTTITNSTTLSFGSKADFSTGASPYPVNVADIDGDGKNDLVTANYGDNNISVLRSTSVPGTISFAAKVNFATGDGPSFLGVGDLDGDGKVDIAVANYGSLSTGNTVSVLRNTSASGSISFAAKVDFTTGTAPWAAAIGDMDGDGKGDLAVSNNGTTSNGTSVSVLRNNSTTLPLTLLSFTGKLIDNNQQVELGWQTTEELDVSVFEAEWGTDGRNWKKIAEVPAKNGSINNYSCIHSGLSDLNYYRLKMVDIDGMFTYSPVLLISTSGVSQPVLFPNPATNNITVAGLENKPVSINLVSANGELIMQKRINATATIIDVSNLSRGIYLVQIIQSGKTFVYKLEKQ